MPAEPGLRFLILILFCSFSIKFNNRPLLLVARNVAGYFFALSKLFVNFRIKLSRPEPSVISASEPEVGVGRFAPLGSSVNACRTWASFFNSDTFLLFFNQILKPATSTCCKNCGRILLCSPIIIYNFRIKLSRPEPSILPHEWNPTLFFTSTFGWSSKWA